MIAKGPINMTELLTTPAHIERNIPKVSDVPIPVTQFDDPVVTGPKFHVEGQTLNSFPSIVSVGVVELIIAHGTTRYPVR